MDRICNKPDKFVAEINATKLIASKVQKIKIFILREWMEYVISLLIWRKNNAIKSELKLQVLTIPNILIIPFLEWVGIFFQKSVTSFIYVLLIKIIYHMYVLNAN